MLAGHSRMALNPIYYTRRTANTIHRREPMHPRREELLQEAPFQHAARLIAFKGGLPIRKTVVGLMGFEPILYAF